MYKVYADGQLLYDLSRNDPAYYIMSATLQLDIDKAGSFDFTVTPDNHLYDNILPMKTVITVVKRNETIFRGRVLTEQIDTFKQKKITCEGDISFFLDSLFPPIESDNMTAGGVVMKIIEEHNKQVEDYKKFTIGQITASKASTHKDMDSKTYIQSKDALENIKSEFGGYFRTRVVGNIIYLDWLENYGITCSQAIRLTENVLDWSDQLDTDKIFTMLVPIGPNNITIADVNDGSIYLQDANLISKYGKIIKTHQFSDIEKVGGDDDDDDEDNDDGEYSKTDLKNKAQEYFNREKVGFDRSFTIKAFDLSYLNPGVDELEVGMMVPLNSTFHGVNRTIMCTSCTFDLQSPENDTYVLGVPVQTLTKQTAASESSTSSKFTQQGNAIAANKRNINWVGDQVRVQANDIYVLTNTAQVQAEQISLVAAKTDENGENLGRVEIEMNGLAGLLALKAEKTVVEELDSRTGAIETKSNNLEIRMNAAEGNISLKASQEDMVSAQTLLGQQQGRLREAEIKIDANSSNILLKASQSDLDTMGGVVSNHASRISAAEVAIDGANSAIRLKADKIDLQGYVTASALSAEITRIEDNYSQSVYSDDIHARVSLAAVTAGIVNLNVTDNLSLAGHAMSLQTFTIVNSFTQALGESSPTTTIVLLVSSYEQPNHWAVHMGETITF